MEAAVPVSVASISGLDEENHERSAGKKPTRPEEDTHAPGAAPFRLCITVLATLLVGVGVAGTRHGCDAAVSAHLWRAIATEASNMGRASDWSDRSVFGSSALVVRCRLGNTSYWWELAS